MELLDEYGHVKIKYAEGEPTPVYNVAEPKLTKKERGVLANYKKVAPQSEIRKIRGEPDVSARWDALKARIEKALSKTPHKDYLTRKIVGMALGYGEISVLVDDDDLEEIMINGINVPVYVYHRKYGMCKTNLVFSSNDAITKLISGLCYINNKQAKPILDFAAIDGNRVNVTGDSLTAKGATLTIRKQRRKTFSIIELIQRKTLSVELAAFLWMAVEGMNLTPANVVIAGSIGSGKTTTLNALSTFIPPAERVVTIEDTFELNLENLDNKVQLETSEDYGMDSLLRDTLRMRPDRIMVGEIRGKEAITLFNAMNIGRIGMGTLHSSSAREVTSRLESPPMSVPASVLGSLDLIVVQNKFVHKGEIVRRVTEVVEVTGAIKDTVMMGQVFEWDPKADDVVRKREQGLETPILFLDKLSDATKYEKAKIIKELKLREAVLSYMLRKGILDQDEVKDFIRKFYLDLEGLVKEAPDLFGKAAKSKSE